MDEKTRNEIHERVRTLHRERLQLQGLRKCLLRILHFLLQQKTVKPYHAHFYREALLDVLEKINGDLHVHDMAEKVGDLYFLCTRMCQIELPEEPPEWFMAFFSLTVATQNGVWYDVDWEGILTRLA